MKIKIKALKTKDAAVYVFPCCNLLHSAFKQVDCYLNDRLVFTSNNNYAYLSYIQDLFSYGKDTQNALLSSQLWIRDSKGKHNTIDGTNSGAANRKSFIQNNEISVIGRLHIGLFQTKNQLLLNHVDIRVILTPSDSKFVLMSAKEFTFEIKEASLFMKKYWLFSDTRLDIEKTLSNGTNTFTNLEEV